MDSHGFGEIVRKTRKKKKIRQADLAMMSGTSRKFIIELESGKPTCELERALNVARSLGIELELTNVNPQNGGVDT